jgi:hypothetical protein
MNITTSRTKKERKTRTKTMDQSTIGTTPRQKSKLTKKFFYSLSTGQYVVSTASAPDSSVYSTYVRSTEGRAAQWRDIVASGVAYRTCATFANEFSFRLYLSEALRRWKMEGLGIIRNTGTQRKKTKNTTPKRWLGIENPFHGLSPEQIESHPVPLDVTFLDMTIVDQKTNGVSTPRLTLVVDPTLKSGGIVFESVRGFLARELHQPTDVEAEDTTENCKLADLNKEETNNA